MLRTCSILCGFLLFASATAHAQEAPKPSWRKEFEEVEVKRIDPQDLPGPEESKFPTSLQSNNVLLPAPAKLETLRETAASISDRVVEVVALTRPNLGLVSPPVYVRGHAVWLSAAPGGADPVLVTNLHWLKGAEKIVVLPAEKRRSGAAPQVKIRSVENQHGDLARLVEQGRGVPVTPVSPDKHRNLVVLSAPVDDLAPPAAGLEFFPYEGQSPTRVYGYSPMLNHALVETKFIDVRVKEKELVFYLQSTYPVVLGAPIVTGDGRVIGMAAMRHPTDQARTLVVPPGAMLRFVRGVQEIEDDSNDE